MIYLRDDVNRPIEIIGQAKDLKIHIRDATLGETHVCILELCADDGAAEIYNAMNKVGICTCNYKECECNL